MKGYFSEMALEIYDLMIMLKRELRVLYSTNIGFYPNLLLLIM